MIKKLLTIKKNILIISTNQSGKLNIYELLQIGYKNAAKKFPGLGQKFAIQ